MAHRWIELPLDWRDGVPIKLLRAVERFLLVSDSSIGIDRFDALEYFMDVLLDAESPAQLQSWARKHDGSDLVLYERAAGGLTERIPSGARRRYARRVVIPRRLLSALIRDVMVFPDEDERGLRESCLREGVDKTIDWIVNQETLLGHLMLEHRGRHALVRQNHDALLAEHARHHR